MDRTRSREIILESQENHTGTLGLTDNVESWDHIMREQCIDKDPTEWGVLQHLDRSLNRPNRSDKKTVARLKRISEVRRQTLDLGGHFRKDTASITGGRYVNATRPSGSYTRFIKGHVMPISGHGVTPAFLTPTLSSTLFALGGEAIRACAPTNPHANLAVAIGEIFHDGLPSAVGVHTLRRNGSQSLGKRLSGEYLNVEFGWKPLIADVLKTFEAAQKADALWGNYVRNSGKRLHREFQFDPLTTTAKTVETGKYPWPPGATQLHANTGSRHTVTRTSTTYWFSGCFRYSMPGGQGMTPKVRRALAKARILYGLDVSPDVIWNLLPWSWLIDWAGDIGGLMHSLSLFSRDGLVLQYGYIMEHRIESTETSLLGHRYWDGSTGDSTCISIRESKRRVRASPFGFGVNEATLTPRQLAILAAVGISHRPVQ